MAENPNSPQQSPRIAHLSLDFHLDTGTLDIAGTVPNDAVGLDMARRLVDEFSWRIQSARMKAAGQEIALAHTLPPGLLRRGN